MTKSNSKRVAARAAPAWKADPRAASADSECEREHISVAGGPIGSSPSERISSQEAAWYVCVSGAPPGG
jgi:hypothetical protein